MMSERAPSGAGLRAGLSKTATLLAKLLGPRHAFENAFDNGLLEIGGNERSGGQNLNVLYAGSGRNLAWILNRLYADFTVRRNDRMHNPFGLRAGIRELAPRADLLIIDTGAMTTRLAQQDAMLKVPRSVRQRLSIKREWPATEAAFERETRNEAKNYISKYGYTCSFSTGARDYFIFYHRFYWPSRKRSQLHEAHIVPRDEFLAECHRGYLIQVRHEGEVRAAALLQRFGRHLASVWGGTAEAENPHLEGLLEVLDYCTVRHAWDARCRTLDFGPSRPFLLDDMLQYKKKWGGRIGFGRLPRANLRFEPLRLTSAVASFLGSTGLIVRDPAGPVAKLLFDDKPCTASDLDSRFQRFAAAGIARYEVFGLHGFGDGARRWAVESRHPVALVDLSGSARPEAEFCRPASVQL